MKELVIRTVSEALRNVSESAARILPRLLAMVIIFVAGWAVAWLVEVILRRLLVLVRVNKLFEAKGLTQLLTRAALPSPADIISRMAFWVVWISFMLVGVNALGVLVLQQEIASLVALLPQFIVALLILFFGFLAANFLSRAVLLAAVNANSPSPRLFSSFVRFLVLLLTVTMALERIRLGRGVVLVAFAISFGGIMMGLAIAFGLGGRNVARRILERRFAGGREAKEDEDKDETGSHL